MAFRIMPERDYLRECLSYDPDTGHLTWLARPSRHFKTDAACRIWNAGNIGNRAGWSNVERGKRLTVRIGGTSWACSRIIWKMMTGEDPPVLVDHKDCDATNDRWINLRLATASQNGMNTRGRIHLKGAYRTKNGKRWASRITSGPVKNRHLGTFDTQAAAHAAYMEAALILHGEFANFGSS